MGLRFAPEEEVAPLLLLREYNDRFVPDVEDLSCLWEEDGACLGGVNAFRVGDLLMVDRLWVSEAHRGRGLGTKLLSTVEDRGRGSGAKRVELNSFGFQAPGFYERLGYRRFGALEPAVGDWGHFFFTKDL